MPTEMTFEQAQSALRRVREKYPTYARLGDQELASRLAAKYPQYAPIMTALQGSQRMDEVAPVTPPTPKAAGAFKEPSPSPVAGPQEITSTRHEQQRQALSVLGVDPALADTPRVDTAALRQKLRSIQRGDPYFGLTQEQLTEQFARREADAYKAARLDIPGVESAVGGFQEAILSTGSVMSRVMRDETSAMQAGLAGREVAADLPDDMVSRAVEGSVRSLTEMFTAAPGGPIGFIAGAATRAVNEAATEGKQAGLTGRDLAVYSTGQGAIEGLVTSAFQLAGFGGLESAFKAPVKSGVMSALRSAGLRSLMEVPEEVAVEVGQAIHSAMAGVDPEAADPDRLAQTVAQTVLTTLVTMGMAETPGIVAAAGSPRPDGAPARPTAEEDQALARETLASMGTTVSGRPVGAEGVSPGQQVRRTQAPSRLQEALVRPAPRDPRATMGEVAEFGEGTTEPTLREEARFKYGLGRRERNPRSTMERHPLEEPVADAQTVRESKLTGQRYEGPQATPPRRRRKSKRYPEGFDERQFFELNEVEQLKADLEAARKESRTDELTGLGNKRQYNETLRDAKKRADRTGKPFSVILFDAANLKAANTVLGHEGADEMLRNIGGILRTTSGTRVGDRVATRQGGDEFAVILPDTDAKGAREVLRKIEEVAGRQSIVPGLSLFLAGDIATYNRGDDLDAALHGADLGVEARKTIIKRDLGEPTERSDAEALVQAYLNTQQPGQQAPPPGTPELGTPTPAQQAMIREETAAERTEREATLARQVRRSRRVTRTSVQKSPPLEGTAHKRVVPKGVEDVITPIMSRIRDISAPVFNRLMRMEFRAKEANERLRKQLHDPATRIARALKNANKRAEFKLLVLNRDHDQARALLRTVDPALIEDFNAFVTTFDALIANLRDAGVTIGVLENYWPRYVRDYDALRELMGTDRGAFEDAWAIAAAAKGRPLNNAEKVEVANTVLQGYGPRKPGSYGMANARSRRIDKVTYEMSRHYVDPLEAAMRYIDGATYAAERARFLGKNHQPAELGETIGAVLSEEMSGLSKEQQDELKHLLTVRFTADMVIPSRLVRNVKQLIYITTLGQFRSTLTQLTDVALTATTHGIIPTAGGILDAVGLSRRRANRIMMEDIGIHDHGEEFKDVGQLYKSTDWTMRKTGFKRVDRFGKESRINAARRAFERAAADPTSKAYQRLKRDYEPVLGQQVFNETMADLVAGRKTENVRYLLFLDIAQIQPVTLSNMPVKYLESPNGRILYSLKMFTAMQLNFVRRDMFRKMRTEGQRIEGLKNLARYIVFFGMLDLGVEFLKEWLRGREILPDDIPDMAADSLLALVGLNRYTVQDVWGSPTDAAMNFIAPPLSFINYAMQDVTSDKPGLRSIRNIPIIGELMYYWAPFGRGYHLTREEAKKDYRKKLRQLRDEAGRALRQGDSAGARHLLAIYNERRKQGPGDGRKTPLTMGSIRQDLDRLVTEE